MGKLADSKLPKLNNDAYCVKCGCGVVDMRYVGWTLDGEAVERICERCGYKWREAPLDA